MVISEDWLSCKSLKVELNEKISKGERYSADQATIITRQCGDGLKELELYQQEIPTLECIFMVNGIAKFGNYLKWSYLDKKTVLGYLSPLVINEN